MGNAQSSAVDRKQTRVAKPKTFSNVRYSTLKSPDLRNDVPSPISSIPYSSYESDTESPTGDRRSKQDLRQQIRTQILSPDDVGEESGGEHLEVIAASLARSLSRSGSRATHLMSANSSSTKLNSASQSSLATERTVNLETAVALLQELRKTASPDDLVALHKALLPVRSGETLSTATIDSIEEVVGTSAAALIRSKSLARPGVATRHAKKEQSVQAQNLGTDASPVNNHYWRPEMMGTSPLTRLTGLDGLDPPPVAENRSHTPADLEYSQLGNLKIGSLVVTNGAASPTPSIVSRDFTPRRPGIVTHEDEYFTASENGSTYEEIENSLPSLPPMNPRRPTTPGNSRCDFSAQRTPEQAPRTRIIAHTRSGSPLKREIRIESSNVESDDDTGSVIVRRPRAVKSEISLVARSENHSLFENTSSDEELRARASHHHTESQSAISLASEYMAEISSSPFAKIARKSRDIPHRPSQDSSIAEIDEGFEDASSHLTQEYSELDEYSLMDSAIMNSEISPEMALHSHPPSSSTPPLKSALKGKRPPQTKTDSGYSSSASTGAVDWPQPFEMEQTNLSTVESVFIPIPKEDVIEVEISEHPASSTKTLQGGPYDDGQPQFTPENPVQTPSKRDQEKSERSRSWKKSMRRSLPRLLSSESTPSRSSASSTPESIPSTKQSKPKKLQKKRPLSQSLLRFGGQHDADGVFPSVPPLVSSRFSERLAASPGMQHLNCTYENASSSDARRGSASPSPSISFSQIVPASYFPDSMDDSPSGRVKRLSTAIDQGVIPQPPMHRHGISRLSFKHQPPAPPKDDEEITGVTDFGTVTQSLGSSPYDIAMQPQLRRPLSVAPTLPHQISTSQPRVGPREGWDAQTASKFAQMRSRERAAAQAAFEEGPLSMMRPPLVNRPMSYHEERPKTGDGRPRYASFQRPKSVHGQRPPAWSNRLPLPLSLDAAKQSPRVPSSEYTSSVKSAPHPGTARSPVSSAPRSSSPVKQLVDVFESRATGPPPSPKPSDSCDWTEQSRLWRERKMHALTSVQTSRSASGASTTTTTTVTTVVSAAPQQRDLPTMSPPTSRKSREQIHRDLPPLPPQELDATRSRDTPSPTPDPNPIPAEPVELSASSKFNKQSIFGRYSGGFQHQRDRAPANMAAPGGMKREITPRTRKVKSMYGVDFGDVLVGI